MFEIVIVVYLTVALLAGLLLWLVQRSDRSAGSAAADQGAPSLAVVLFLAGLAWPLSLPLVAYGWFKEHRVRRTARR